MMYWLGARFARPSYYEAAAGSDDARAILFYQRPVRTEPEALDRHFTGIDVVFMRSGWDKDASWVGFKGGDNAANHSHLDLGCFVFDALGERWAMDPGPDNYNLPGYFGKERWIYYRCSTAGQNTLLLDSRNQQTKGKGPIVTFRSTGERPRAVADLTGGYTPLATKVLRGVALVDGRRSLLVQDEVEAPQPVEYVWQMHTRAAVKVDGTSATLSRNGKTATVRLLDAPDGARIDVEPATAPPPQNPNEGIGRVVVRLSGKVTTARVAVLIETKPSDLSAKDVTPLGEWGK
jgi:hypothetical protein